MRLAVGSIVGSGLALGGEKGGDLGLWVLGANKGFADEEAANAGIQKIGNDIRGVQARFRDERVEGGVAGQVEGDIDSAGHVEITETARISGTVSGEAIAVAEGAVVEGVMKTTGNTEPKEFVEKRQDD